MAPPQSFYVPENYGGQHSVDDFDHDPTTQHRIVNTVRGIVEDFSKSFTTYATINKDNTGAGDFDSIDSAENAVFGNHDSDYQDVGTTVVQEITTSFVNDVTTEMNKVTNYFLDEDIKHVFPSEHFGEDKNSPNTPLIILVVILAVLVVITIVALVVYQKRKAKNNKIATGVTVIGKTFKSESDEKQETQMPQQIMYGEQ